MAVYDPHPRVILLDLEASKQLDITTANVMVEMV